MAPIIYTPLWCVNSLRDPDKSCTGEDRGTSETSRGHEGHDSPRPHSSQGTDFTLRLLA